MNVLESRSDRPLRLRPWVLLTGAVVVIAAVLYFTDCSSPGHSGSTTPTHRAPVRARALGGRRGSGRIRRGFLPQVLYALRGRQNVAANTTISLTFSRR